MTKEIAATAATAAVAIALMGCAGSRMKTDDCTLTPKANQAITCEVPGFDDREYDLITPPGFDPAEGEPLPLVFVLHGGGGRKEGTLKQTCPDGDLDSPECFHTMAGQRGYAVVVPNGTSNALGLRTWNGGGGTEDWRCVSGPACEEGVDDIAYFRAVLAHVRVRIPVDESRIYATGISNGGAMSYRLACEMSEEIVAIAPIGGAMQLTTQKACSPVEPVAVLHIHGTGDECWRYEGGAPTCGNGITGQRGRKHVSVERTMSEWVEINECSPETTTRELVDAADDGTRTTRVDYGDCSADVSLLRIDEGGHTWPRGNQYFGESLIGKVPQDWGNEVLLDWFDGHVR